MLEEVVMVFSCLGKLRYVTDKCLSVDQEGCEKVVLRVVKGLNDTL